MFWGTTYLPLLLGFGFGKLVGSMILIINRQSRWAYKSAASTPLPTPEPTKLHIEPPRSVPRTDTGGVRHVTIMRELPMPVSSKSSRSNYVAIFNSDHLSSVSRLPKHLGPQPFKLMYLNRESRGHEGRRKAWRCQMGQFEYAFELIDK